MHVKSFRTLRLRDSVSCLLQCVILADAYGIRSKCTSARDLLPGTDTKINTVRR